MLDKDIIIKVTNRDNGVVAYTVPDLDVTRHFQKNETKEISMDELRKLSYLPGGQTIIDNYFIIHNKEAVEELVSNIQPEYFYTEEEVKKLLSSGTLDQLDDCLSFAPQGVIELIKEIAVRTKLNDIKKRDLIFEKTGYNISRAIEINRESQENDKIEDTGSQRKAKPIEIKTEENIERKSEPVVIKNEFTFPEYKVVDK